MRRILGVVILWMAAALVAAAADVWETPYAQWSDKDVDKVLTDSPWAGKASLTHAREGANLGPVPDWKLIVSVQSAVPVRQAQLRKNLGAGVAPPPEADAALSAAMPRYVFAISGIPRMYQNQLAKSAQAATMKPKGKPAVSATDASVILIGKDGKPVPPAPAPGRAPQASNGARIVTVAQRGGGFGGGGFGGFGTDNSGITATLIVEFPKTAPLTAADQEVEISTVIGGYHVKRTFKLRDMMVMGTLAI